MTGGLLANWELARELRDFVVDRDLRLRLLAMLRYGELFLSEDLLTAVVRYCLAALASLFAATGCLRLRLLIVRCAACLDPLPRKRVTLYWVLLLIVWERDER